jgi:4-amino-4-deoxy-L-arabinose transferase-like glycosyltransferase
VPPREVSATETGSDRLPWALAAILAIAVLLRLPGLFAGLWHDEVMYSRVYFDFPERRSWLLWHDVHPPGYPLLLWLWSSLLGNREAILRLPSFLAGLGSLVVVWQLARRWFGDTMALLATAVLALSPPHIWYSVENKANMVALFLSTLAVWLFVRVAEGQAGFRHVLGAVAALLGALATHSYAIATAATIVVWLGWRAWHERTLRRPVLLGGPLLLLGWLALFLWKALSQGLTLARPYLRPLDLGELYKLLFVWFPHGNTIRCISPYSRFTELLRQPWPYLLVDGVCAALLGSGLVAAVRAAKPGADGEGASADPWPARLLLLWLVPPLLAGLVLSLFVRRFYIERNFLSLLPPFAILLALAARGPRGRRARLVAGAAVLGLSVAAAFALLIVRSDRWTVYKPKPDWRGAASWLEAEAGNRGRLVLATTTPSLETAFYLPADRLRPTPVIVIDVCKPNVPWIVLARQGGGSFWLVKNETWSGCWAEALQQATSTPGLRLGQEKRFAQLVLYELVGRYASP